MNMLMRRTWIVPLSGGWTQGFCSSLSHGEPEKAYSTWRMEGGAESINNGTSSDACAHSFGFGHSSRLDREIWSRTMSIWFDLWPEDEETFDISVVFDSLDES